MKEFLRYPKWIRAGHGRSFQFYVTNEEFRKIIEQNLLEEYSPYSLLTVDLVKRPERYRQKLCEFGIGQFLELRKEGFDTFYLRSKILTPMIPLGEYDHIEGDLVVNGLVDVTQGMYFEKGGWQPSSLGIVHRVIDEKTGAVIAHKEYDRIFAALKRAAKKLLRYDLIQHLPNGESYPLKGIRMSEEFAKLMAAGEVKTNVSIA